MSDSYNGTKVTYEIDASQGNPEDQALLKKLIERIESGQGFSPFDLMVVNPADMTAQGRSEFEETHQVIAETQRQRAEFQQGVDARGMDDFSADEKLVIESLLYRPQACDDILRDKMKGMKNADAIAISADLTAINFFEAEARHMQAAILRDENYTITMKFNAQQLSDTHARLSAKRPLSAAQESQFNQIATDARKFQLELLREGDKSLLPYMNGILRETVCDFREAHFALAALQATAKAADKAPAAPAANPAAPTAGR